MKRRRFPLWAIVVIVFLIVALAIMFGQGVLLGLACQLDRAQCL